MGRDIDPAVEARVRESFARQSMMSTVGAEMVAVRPGETVIAADIPDGFRQQQGFAHASLIFALGDNAAGFATLSLLPPEQEVLTAEIKINLLSPGQGRLIATGRVLKPGRRLMVVSSDVWAELEDGSRKHVAVMQGTMVPVNL